MATHRAVTRLGPNLTLADVAREAGVSAATLVQRFGSKRGLLLAFASLAAEGTDEEYAAIRRTHPDPLDAIREVVRCFAQLASSPERRMIVGAVPIAALPPGDYVVRAIVSVDGRPVGRVLRTLRKGIGR